MTRGNDEAGMILVNVLMFVAIASGLVLLMITREELALDRGLRMREAARALAIVRGGEASALVALRRDAEAGNDSDHASEAWGRLAEKAAPIDGGSFDLAIADAESRFNVNSLRSGDASAIIFFHTLAREIGMSPEQTLAAAEYVRREGPVTDLRPIRLLGLAPEAAARMERLVTALPGATTVNINAADREMLAMLFHDPVVAERLAAVRQRQGYLTLKDLSDQRVTLPWGASFRSDTYWVRTRATIGGTSQQGVTLIQRRRTPEGQVEAIPVERWRGAAVPPGAPALP